MTSVTISESAARRIGEILKSEPQGSMLRVSVEGEIGVSQIVNDQQLVLLRHRDMLVEIDHPTAGAVRMAGIPVKFSATPASIRMPPPLLGQHTEDVLASWLGMGRTEIEELKIKNIV